MGELIDKKRTLWLITLQLILTGIQAKEMPHGIDEGKRHVHGAHKECPLPKSREDIIDCALVFHPIIQRYALKIESVTKLEDQAAQIPNPTLSTRYVRGDDRGETISELESNLSFTLELGGKRDSRINYAQARKREVLASNRAIKADVKISTILNMYRLRQINEEERHLTEALRAFSKVIGQLKKLPRLSAEQESSLTLFEMAFEEARVNESELYEEERKLEHYFHVATGHSLSEIKPYLPKTQVVWPSIAGAQGNKVSPEIEKLNSLVDLAAQEFEIQKSEAWSNLSIGPSFAIEKDGALENKMIGINVQIPIPLFQVNAGGKAFSKSELHRARKNVDLTKAEENHERFEQLRVYESAVSILSKTMKPGLIEHKHSRIEKLYLRGVVSSSVFLDSLKQKLSYLKSRNNRELTAVSALLNIHKYDGRILEEKI